MKALKLKRLTLLAIFTIILSTSLNAQPQAEAVELLEKLFVIDANVAIDDQEEPLEALLLQAEEALKENSDAAELWIAVAQIRATYARTQGLGGRGIIKTVREELEAAIDIDSNAMDGMAQAYLGQLYAVLPSWPLSYGSKKKARPLLDAALEIKSDSMVNNYYYAIYMMSLEDFPEAVKYLEIASTSAPIPNTPIWTESLLKAIEGALKAFSAESP